MTIVKNQVTKMLRLADMANEDSDSLYVKTNATRLLKSPTWILLTHKSSQDQSILVINIPATWIPFNLADYVPKEELLKNTQLMRLINNKVLELIPTDRAEEMLDDIHAQKELDRLLAERMASFSTQTNMLDPQTKDIGLPPNITADIPKASMGDIPELAQLVSGTVFDIFSNKYSDDERAVMLRNLSDILTDEEKRYIRGQTDNKEILNIVK